MIDIDTAARGGVGAINGTGSGGVGFLGLVAVAIVLYGGLWLLIKFSDGIKWIVWKIDRWIYNHRK